MKKILLFLLLLFSMFVLTGCVDYEEKYEALQEQYDELEMQYEKLSEEKYDAEEKFNFFLWSVDDQVINLYEYFEEESISFDEAYNAYYELRNIIHQFY